MKRSGSQNRVNVDCNNSSDETKQLQHQKWKNQVNQNNNSKSSENGECTFLDNLHSISTANEISLQVSQTSRIHNFRQKSLDFQVFHNHSPKLGISINSERNSIQNNHIQYRFCQKHPNRKAKYYATSESNYLLCSKCALGSALKGQKIEQVIAQEEKYRKLETDAFMENLRLTQEILLLSDEENGRSKDRIKEFYDKQLKIINEVFNDVENILVEERNLIVQKIHISMGDSLRQMEELRTKIKLFKFETDQQERDISNHYENIISEMENQPFAEIMKSYNQKLSKIQFNVHNINQSKIHVRTVDKGNLDHLKKSFEQQIILINNKDFEILEKGIYQKYLNLFSKIQYKQYENISIAHNNKINLSTEQSIVGQNILNAQTQPQDMIRTLSQYGDRRYSKESQELPTHNSYLIKTDPNQCFSTDQIKQSSQYLQPLPITKNKIQSHLKFIRPTNNNKRHSGGSQIISNNPIEQQYQLLQADITKKTQTSRLQRDPAAPLSKTNISILSSSENIDQYKKPYPIKQNEKPHSSIEKRLVKKNIPQVNIDFRVLGTNLTNSLNTQK